jgi:hypothetical protein
VASVEAEAGTGLVGDRYHGSRHRHVTVQALDDLDAAAEVLGRPVDPGLTRRNITLTSGPIPTRPGELKWTATAVDRLARPRRDAGPALASRRDGLPAAVLGHHQRRGRGRGAAAPVTS